MVEATWMLFGDLRTGLGNGPYGASYGFLFGLTLGVLSGLTESTDHPSGIPELWVQRLGLRAEQTDSQSEG